MPEIPVQTWPAEIELDVDEDTGEFILRLTAEGEEGPFRVAISGTTLRELATAIRALEERWSGSVHRH